MPSYIIPYQLPPGDRVQKRKALVNQFLLEEPGKGTGNLATYYRYDVETYNNYCIYLQRPGWLNKGFDFSINIEWIDTQKRKFCVKPTHDYIIRALLYCKRNILRDYALIDIYIKDIYNCNEVNIESFSLFFIDDESQTHPVQIIFLALKWLFMEQDCNYWNYSGRDKLFSYLVQNELVTP